MNAMIRALKGTLAVLALAGAGQLLRWVTAGSISGARTYDLDSLTVLAVGTVAWIAYAWLALAVVTTVLEQIPGVVGELAGAVAGRITTKTARALLRSGLGVAAVTPLTVGAAQATPDHSSHVLQWNQTTPTSTIHLTDSNWRTTEPRSTLQLGGTATSPTSAAQPSDTDAHRTAATQPQSAKPHQDSAAAWRATEPASNLQIGGAEPQAAAPQQDSTRSHQESAGPLQVSAKSQQYATNTWRATEPASALQISGNDTHRTTAAQQDSTQTHPDSVRSQQDSAKAEQEGARRPGAGGRVRVGVPDRPAAGAATRYTEVRAGGAGRVVVREGDSLWALAARELGAGASNEAIAARWPEWYAANRHVIGDDPDLILPGQVLRVPPASTGHLPPTHQEP
ncbi:LysM peptidoglycan-binding domain-containing protein [Kribbella soli]